MNEAEKLAAAQQDAADAQALAVALEARVVDGDEAVTAEELAARKDLAHFAELRVKAAERQQERVTAVQLAADIEALGQEARLAATLGTARLATAAQNAVAALVELHAQAAERDQRHRVLSERIREAYGKAPHLLRDLTSIKDLAPGHNFALGFAVAKPDGTRTEFRHVAAAHAVIAATAVALEACVRPIEHDAIQLHTELVLDAAGTVAELPELAPPDWRRTY